MQVSGLNHYTLRCTPDELRLLHDFYVGCLQLHTGDRPTMPAPGYWLYCGDRPIVHLYASLSGSEAGTTAALDHISFSAQGLEATRAHLRAKGLAFDEAPVPGWPIHQIFVRDPLGLKIELTFDLDREGEAGNDQAR